MIPPKTVLKERVWEIGAIAVKRVVVIGLHRSPLTYYRSVLPAVVSRRKQLIWSLLDLETCVCLKANMCVLDSIFRGSRLDSGPTADRCLKATGNSWLSFRRQAFSRGEGYKVGKQNGKNIWRYMLEICSMNGTTFPPDVKGFKCAVVLVTRKERKLIVLLANVATVSIYDLSIERRSVHPLNI